MPQHTKDVVYAAMEKNFIIPLFFHGDTPTAVSIVEACVRGGAGVIEFTRRGDNALDVFEKMVEHCRENLKDVILGAGSIADDLMAADFINAGADFIVSPFFKKEIAIYCQDQDVPYLPGCGTATEIANAEQNGIEICKIFPAAQIGGPAFIKAIKAPMPASKLMPTGGVDNTLENLKGWTDAGAFCVGMGSSLLSSELINAGDFEAIEKNVVKAMGYAVECRE